MPLRADFTIESMQQRAKGTLPGVMGFHIVELKEGLLRAEMLIRPDMLAPNGYLHAASIIALADSAAGHGCFAHLPEGAQNFTTIELKCNFLGTTKQGLIECVAKPVHLGRTTQVWDVVVTQAEKTLALFRCTQMVLWPK